MKPLNEGQRNDVWEAINQALVDSANPRDGELTNEQISEATGQTEPQLREKLKRLIREDVLGVRKIATEGNKYNVYFPLKETSMDEVLEILTE